MAAPIQLDFVTRKNCPLCEKGLALLDPYVATGRIELAMHDVDDDPGLAGYSDRVPVLLRDGRVIAEGRFGKLSLRLRLLLGG